MTSQPLAPKTSPKNSSSSSTAEKKPLSGLLVVITQAEEDAAGFANLLRAQGAKALFYPCMDVAPPRNIVPLDDAVQHAAAGKFDWLIVTDINVVHALAQRLAEAEMAVSALADLRVAAVGSEAAQAVADHLGLTAEIVPNGSTGAALADATKIQSGQRILLPQSARDKTDVAKALTAAGADVTTVVAYRMVLAQGGDDVPTMLWQGKIDAVTFTSPSTLRFFRKRLDIMGGKLGMLQDVVVACMDPATGEIAGQHGLRVRVMPEDETEAGLVEALARYFDGS